MSFSPRFIKESSMYMTANVINAAIPFLLLPFLTNHLSPADYGILAMFQLLTTAVTPFISLNFDATLSRYYFEYDDTRITKLLANGIAITCLSAIVMAIIFQLFRIGISDVSDFPKGWLWTIVVFSFLQKIIEIPLALWRVQHKPLQYAILRILRTFFDIGFSVSIILLFDSGWEGRVSGQLLSVFIFGSFSFFYLLRKVNFQVSLKKNETTKIFRFGAPLIMHELGAFIMTFSDRLFITNMVGIADTGVYSVGYQIGMVIGLLQNSFNQAWVPWFYNKLSKGEFRDKLTIVKITYIYNLALLGLVVVLYICQPLLLLILGKDFAASGQFILWIGLGFAFNGMYKMVVNYLFFLKKTYLVGVLTVCAAIVNIILNYFLIGRYGSIGAAYSAALVFLFQFLITWIICTRTYNMPWALRFKL